MRGWIAVGTMLMLGACSAEAPPEEKEDPPILLKAGQWDFSRKTTGYNTPTVTAEEYAAKTKETSQDSVCVAVDAKGLPDADALAGDEGSECSYKDTPVMRKGRMIANLSCKKSANGTAELQVEGNYTADTITLGVSMTRSVGANPILRTTHDLSGKRTGECKPATT
jgi:hypothetical protein